MAVDNGKKVEWMYEGGNAMKEEFLVGRKITDIITCQDDLDKNAQCEVLVDRELLERRAQIDMNTKMREDPLFLIRKKEEEQRKRILENPVKYKQLHQVIAAGKPSSLPTSSIRSESANGAGGKSSHSNGSVPLRRETSSEESSSDSDSDDELLAKYLSILARKYGSKTQAAGSQTSEREEYVRHRDEKRSKGGKRKSDAPSEKKRREPESKKSKKSRDVTKGSSSSTKGLSKEEIEAKLRKMTANAEQHAADRRERFEKKREEIRRESDSLMRKAKQTAASGVNFREQAHAAVAKAQLSAITTLSDRLNRTHSVANRQQSSRSELDEARFTDR